MKFGTILCGVAPRADSGIQKLCPKMHRKISISQKRLDLQLSGLEGLLPSTISPDCHLYLCKRLKRKIQTCEHFQEYSKATYCYYLSCNTHTTVSILLVCTHKY